MVPSQSSTSRTASKPTLVVPGLSVSAGTRPNAELTGDFAPRSARTALAWSRAGSVGKPEIGTTGVSSSVARTMVAESRMCGGAQSEARPRGWLASNDHSVVSGTG